MNSEFSSTVLMTPLFSSRLTDIFDTRAMQSVVWIAAFTNCTELHSMTAWGSGHAFGLERQLQPLPVQVVLMWKNPRIFGDLAHRHVGRASDRMLGARRDHQAIVEQEAPQAVRSARLRRR